MPTTVMTSARVRPCMGSLLLIGWVLPTCRRRAGSVRLPRSRPPSQVLTAAGLGWFRDRIVVVEFHAYNEIAMAILRNATRLGPLMTSRLRATNDVAGS